MFETFLIAGWSSSVARRAHNPKVVGSNPTPAINYHDMIDSLWQTIALISSLLLIFYNKIKAGDENRTRDDSLEGCGFTTKLHPHGGLDGTRTRDLLRDRQAF